MASTVSSSQPDACLLSNGHFSVFLTSAGSGYSTVDGIDITRWREDVTCDCWGQYYYIRDLEEGRVWSAGRQPLGRAGEEYMAELRPDLATFRRRDGEIDTLYEIAVVPDVNAEVRRLTLTNNSDRTRTVEVTSYAEVALNPRRTDQAHPAFAKLFLETEHLQTPTALLCRRRPRAEDQQPIWALHVLADPVSMDCITSGDVQFETDRARFLGRGRSARNPAALDAGVTLSGTEGPVLDPVFSLRRRIVLTPRSSTALAFTTAMPGNREQALILARRFSDLRSVDGVFDEATSNWQTRLAALNLAPHDAAVFQFLASHVILTRPFLRSPSSVVDNKRGQASLWAHGISGDVPIALLRIAADTGLELTSQLLQAHRYWRWCGLVADLVILNDAGPDLRQQIDSLVQSSPSRELVKKPAGIFLLDAAHLTAEDNTLLEAAARIVLRDADGNVPEQLSRAPRQVDKPGPAASNDTNRSPLTSSTGGASATTGEHLLFDNGIGGFNRNGTEYVIAVRGNERPPAPWTNVLANPDFGCLVTEAGGGYTWAGNSQMNRLTPWSNDPVSDPPGEVLYLRDEETGEFWTPTPAPSGGDSTTIVRHGQGYTRFTQTSHGLKQDLFILVSPTEPVKLFHLRVENPGNRSRRMSTVLYAEWVVGIQRDQAPMQVGCAVDRESGALFAVSAWAGDFAGRVAFADVSRRPRSFTTDRMEFLGREGTTANPRALAQDQLSNRAAELPDPCAAIMTRMEVPPGETQEIVFVLGQAVSPEEARRLVRAYADPVRAHTTLAEVRTLWDSILGTVQVRTPDAAFDLMLNRWLLYQALSCRMWGRSGLYQSGGAFGFRDQLQDSMALVWSSPKEARAQILRAAARQFEEGDVQHWWHPPAGRGVRTRITDDLYFLPLVTCHYIRVSGDVTILDEPVPFLRSPVLRPDQEEDYCLPAVSDQTAALYEHCVRALDYGLKLGAHGIPLMGTGDWNDGMNKVGAHGEGESIWNGWFMATTLQDFAVMANSRGDTARAAWCRERAEALRASLEEHAWDGQWYRRAYFDDGTPLGSATNDECQIDSIAQSWAVISAAADPARARQAMEAVQQRLVRESDGLILLFDPPFDKGVLEPGYIKGYVPGIRENGGQYTHAATWVVLATALLGQGERAAELFGLLNPIHHADLPEKVARYKVEPYVVAADVYGRPPHTGRGGWTWYTGSAAWLYRVGLEAILGFHQRGSRLEVKPCVPPGWPQYEITWHYRSATYHVVVDNSSGSGGGIRSLTVDGRAVPTGAIDLADDGQRHEVRLTTAARSGEELVHAAG
jgi:cyclic beta-1,2-glucan synthetase